MKSLLITLLVAILIASAYFVYVKIRDDAGNAQEDTPQNLIEEEKRILLYNEAKFDFSLVDTRYEIPISQIPTEFRPLILNGAQNAKFYELMYNMDSVGYQVDFDIDGLLIPTYQGYGLLVRNNPEWNLVSGARMEHFAFREMESPRYYARIYQAQVGDNTVRISIEIISK